MSVDILRSGELDAQLLLVLMTTCCMTASEKKKVFRNSTIEIRKIVVLWEE